MIEPEKIDVRKYIAKGLAAISESGFSYSGKAEKAYKEIANLTGRPAGYLLLPHGAERQRWSG